MLRVISGIHRGRALTIPKTDITRPTSDKVRSAIFNLLMHKDWLDIPEMPLLPEDATVLDLFAGSGALGIEAISRGARQAWLVETHAQATSAIVRNIETLKIGNCAKMIRADATKLPRANATAAGQCTLVFADPPYEKGLIPPALSSAVAGNWLSPVALVVGETSHTEQIALPDAFTLLDHRLYSDTAIWIWRYQSAGSEYASQPGADTA